jgi:hypothetical protein
MNKEKINFSLDGLKTIFNRITQYPATGNPALFCVWMDGVQIVPATSQVERLLDFMHLEFTFCQTMTVFVFDEKGTITDHYEMDLPGNFRFDTKHEQIAVQLEMAQGEIRHLKRELKAAQRERVCERPQDFKVVDAGNMLVLFVDKEKISEAMRDQLTNMENSARMTKNAIRIFERFLHKKEKE